MKTIIIDSGSTKADIAVIEGDDIRYYRQQGINTQIANDITFCEALINDIKNAGQIFYYGAGCDTDADKGLLEGKFKEYNVAVSVKAHSDMLGACRATAGNKPGIVSILGTGSNSCVYDGSEIVDIIPQYGYLLHDDGGGSYIGKLMLQDYFDGDMPDDLAIDFQSKFDLTREHVLFQLYKADNTSRYLASHVEFLSSIKGKWKKKVLNKSFDSFIKKRIVKYTDYAKYDLYFVGSIAFHFEKRLTKALEKYDLKIKSVVQKPIEKLAAYHNANK